MDKGQKTIAVLLLVLCTLQGLNLLAKTEPRAVAQVPLAGPEAPKPISIGWVGRFETAGSVLRMYDDGSVETVYVEEMGPACSPGVVCNGNLIDFCVGDLDYNGTVDVDDLVTVVTNWGMCVDDGSQ